MQLGSPWVKHLEAVTKNLTEKTSGQLMFSIHPAGQLGDAAATANECKSGYVDIWLGSFHDLWNIAPDLSVFSLPYLFRDRKIAAQTVDSLRGSIADRLRKVGLQPLWFTEMGERSVWTRSDFVKSPADLQGKKLCTSGEVNVMTLKELGAKPESKDPSETVGALQMGEAVGFDGAPLPSEPLWQLVSHLTVTRHSYEPGLAVMNLKAWERLPKELHEFLASDDESRKARGPVRGAEQEYLKQAMVQGLRVHHCTQEELDVFKAATAPVHAQLVSRTGEVSAGRLYSEVRRLI